MPPQLTGLFKILLTIPLVLVINLSYSDSNRTDDVSILDVDANGEVDALTDGLLLLRSMFKLTDDALVTGVVDSANCKECDAEGIDSYITSIKGTSYGGLTPEPGPAGPQGEKGDKGDTGAQGVQGATGAQGSKGDTGDTGPAGPQGEKGDKGDTGAQGVQGATGAQGPQGATGAAGADGSDGATGPQGATGAQGPQGATGAQGPQGATGAAGADGSDGATGSTGPAGATGAAGADGRGLAWVSASNNVNGYWYYAYNQAYMAVQLSGSDLVYTSPYDPEDGSVLDYNQYTAYTSENCQGMAYVDYAPLSRLEFSGSGYLVKRTSQKGGASITANSYYGQYNGVYQCVNSQASNYITSSYYETEQTSLLMSTYQQSHTLRWSN